MGLKSHTAAATAAVALGYLLAPPFSIAIDAITNALASFVAADNAKLSFVSPAPAIMRYLRNNGIFAFGHADRARTSASFREILDAMWLFNAKFEQALSKFDEIKTRQQG